MTRQAAPVPEGLPDYCCAILEDPRGRLLLERRPPEARRASGQITCFGGAREPGEGPETCLRRELLEELGWEPEGLELRVILRVEGSLTAWFYRAPFESGLERLNVAPGMRAILAHRSELPGLPLSPWHRAVLEAESRGETLVTWPPG